MRLVRLARWKLVVALASFSLVAAACATPQATPGPVAVDVTLNEFKIAVDRTAPAGRPLKLQVHNQGSAVHNLATEVDGKVFQMDMIDAGGTAILDLPALKSGTYKLWCDSFSKTSYPSRPWFTSMASRFQTRWTGSPISPSRQSSRASLSPTSSL